MKRVNLLAIWFGMILWFPLAMAQSSPVGEWVTIDDKTGKERAVVKLTLDGDVLHGVITKIYPQAGDTGMCSKCPGAFKNKPIVGLQFMWGLKDKGHGVWSGGEILDAQSGKIYRVKLTVKKQKLYVRGYVGFSLLGRTQVWLRQ